MLESLQKTGLRDWLKGIVHPKMNILSFTHPEVGPNLSECLCSVEHKGRYSEEWGKQQYFFSYYGSQWCPKTAWLQTFFKISSFVFRTNTFIQVWIYLRVSKWQHFHFWVNHPFKVFLMHCSIPFWSINSMRCILKIPVRKKCASNIWTMHLINWKNDVWSVGHFIHSTVNALIT